MFVPSSKCTAPMMKALWAERFGMKAGYAEYVYGFEVLSDLRNGASRRIDCVAMSCYGSTDFAIHGGEIKVSRSDLLAELKSPEKTEATASMVDFFWLVCPRDILKSFAEVPPSWGILCPNDVGGLVSLRSVRAAKRLKKNADISRSFAASIARSAMLRGSDKRVLDAAVEAAYRHGQLAEKDRSKSTVQRELSEMDDWRVSRLNMVDQILRFAGRDSRRGVKFLSRFLNDGDGAEIIEAWVRVVGVLTGRIGYMALEDLKNRLDESAKGVSGAMEELEKAAVKFGVTADDCSPRESFSQDS